MKNPSALMPSPQKTRLRSEKNENAPYRGASAASAIQHRFLTSAVLAGMFLLGCATTLYAEEKCMPAVVLEAALIDWYGESPIKEGPRNLVVWSSVNGETWTLVAYHPDGTACTLSQGQNWKGAASLAQLAHFTILK